MNDKRKGTEIALRPALGARNPDHIAAALKAIVGSFPGVGAVLTEIVMEIVPNQRIDRVEQYLTLLAAEVDQLKLTDKLDRMAAPENINLIEEGAYQAARGVSEERRKYIAHAVAQGIASDDRDKINEMRILKIIEELDDYDFILLDAYEYGSFGKWEDIRPETAVIGSPPDVIHRWEMYESALSRLEGLRLTHKNITMNRTTNLPEFNQDGSPQGYHRISTLGKLILDRVGLTGTDRPPATDGLAEAFKREM